MPEVNVVAQALADAVDLRRGYSGLLTPDDVRTARGGVVPGGLSLSKVTGMTARLAPGQVWVVGTSETGQGAYLLDWSDDLELVLADGDATRDRIDLVVGRVRDDAHDATGQTSATVEVIQGAYPSVGQQPTAPAVPDSAEYLGQWRVNAGTSAGSGGLDDSLRSTVGRRPATALGGVLPVASQAEQDALAGLYPGRWIDRLDRPGASGLRRFSGTSWESPFYEDVDWTQIDKSAEPSWKSRFDGAEVFYAIRAGMVTISLAMIRAGGPVVPNPVGDISPQENLLDVTGTVPLPAREVVFAYSLGYYASGMGKLGTGGMLQLSSVTPEATINQDDYIRATFTYPI